jgi:hypothetical protein
MCVPKVAYGKIGILERSQSSQQIKVDVISSDEPAVKIRQRQTHGNTEASEWRVPCQPSTGGVIPSQERIRRKVAHDRRRPAAKSSHV